MLLSVIMTTLTLSGCSFIRLKGSSAIKIDEQLIRANKIDVVVNEEGKRRLREVRKRE